MNVHRYHPNAKGLYNQLDMTSNFSSPEFVERTRRKDPAALEELVKAYNGHLYRAAMGMGMDPNRAGELTQETWAAFFQSAPNFQGRSHIRTFLFGILYNKASEQWRTKAKHESHDELTDYMESRFDDTNHWVRPPSTPEEEFLKKEVMQLLEECLERVPEQQRAAFYLREVEGESTADICNLLDITTTNLGVIMFRAKNRVRECLEDRLSKD